MEEKLLSLEQLNEKRVETFSVFIHQLNNELGAIYFDLDDLLETQSSLSGTDSFKSLKKNLDLLTESIESFHFIFGRTHRLKQKEVRISESMALINQYLKPLFTRHAKELIINDNGSTLKAHLIPGTWALAFIDLIVECYLPYSDQVRVHLSDQDIQIQGQAQFKNELQKKILKQATQEWEKSKGEVLMSDKSLIFQSK